MSTETERRTDRPIATDTFPTVDTPAGTEAAAAAAWPIENVGVDRLPESAEDFDPAAAYLSQLGEGSRRTMREALARLAGWASQGRCDAHDLPWHNLRNEHTAALRTRLISSLAPATANKYLAALRGVLKQSWRQGQMSAEAYQRAIDLPPARGASPRKLPRLGLLELRQLAQACRGDKGPAGARDEALLALLYGASLRRSEAVTLELLDYDLAAGRLRVGTHSGRKERVFIANDDARSALERWIAIRGGEPGPLFNPVNKGGRIERRKLSEQAIYIACQKRASEAGLPPTSPEDLRRANTTRHDQTERSGNGAVVIAASPSASAARALNQASTA
ncbi:MAG: tyrosine-type recombinase/integrase [Myxococcales bacterium]|nr:integrase [Myxococcales bacterium]HIL80031.1 integrase [Myxococcales bacterium]